MEKSSLNHTHKQRQEKLTVSGIRNHFNTHTHTRARARARTHTHTHTHTLLPSVKQQKLYDIKYQRLFGGKQNNIDTPGEQKREELPLYKSIRNWKPFKHEWVQVSLSIPFIQQAGNIYVCKNEINEIFKKNTNLFVNQFILVYIYIYIYIYICMCVKKRV